MALFHLRTKALIGCSLFALGAAAHAQSTAPATGIDEVVVTAQKRSQSSQEVPIAITALTGDSLKDAGIDNALTLASSVPSLQIGNNGDSMEIFIRGIGSTNDTEVGDPAVAFNVDGIYNGRPSGAGGTFYDINRVEVLRGPQGTLYGRNATAGAVNVITNDPVAKYAGDAAITFGNYGTIDSEGMLNVPVTDSLAVRAAFRTEDHSGYTINKNVTEGVTENSNDAQNAGGRFKALWTPTEDLSIRLSADYYHAGGVGPAQQLFSVLNSDGSVTRFDMSGKAGRTDRLDTQGSLDDTFGGGSVDINYDLGMVKLTSVTAYRINNRNTVADGDGTDTYSPSEVSTFWSRFNQFSQELRAASNYDSPLQWVAGLFYYQEHNNVYLNITNDIANGTGLRFVQPVVKENSRAAFGQADYSIFDNLKLTFGLRGTDDDKTRYGSTDLVNDATNPETVIADILPNAAHVASHRVNWKTNLDWEWQKGNSLYATVGTGYKAGGYDDGSANNTYKPENLTAYEVGSKNRFLDNRAQVNLSAYYYDYQNFQISEVTQLPNEPAGALGTVTYNAQKATAQGVEMEDIFKITPDDKVDLNLTYEHSEFNKFLLPAASTSTPCPDGFLQPVGGYCNMAGNRLQHSPQWTVSAGYQHIFTLPNQAALTASVRTYVSTKYYLFPINSAAMEQGGYSRTDVFLNYDSPDGRYYVQVFGRNLEDNNIAVQASQNNGENFVSLAPPRTFGVTFGGRF
jgi:iron complex outermembrane receptor protein